MSNLALESISVKFGDFVALDAIDLEIGAGEIVALTGPSGAGKTTTCRVIAGLERPSSGRVLIDGSDVTSLIIPKRQIGYMFESFALYPQLTVYGNLQFALKAPLREKLSADEIHTRIEEITALAEIDHLVDRLPNELSGGQKQRVALCRTLVQRPRAYLLDEPISHLDAKLRHVLRGALRRRLHDMESPTLWVSPDAMEALSVADRCAVLHEGKIEQFGTPQELYERPATVNVARLVGDPAMNLLSGELQGEGSVVRFVHPALKISIGDRARRGLEANNFNRNVVLGLRPQDIRIANGLAGQESAELEVYTFEPLGKYEIITVLAGTDRLKVKTVHVPSMRPGDKIRLDLTDVDPFFFDASDGSLLA